MSTGSLMTGMKMANLSELWKTLRESAQADSADEYRLRLCHSGQGLRLFAAVTGTQRDAAIIVEVAAELLPTQLGNISGTRLGLSAAQLPGLPPGRGALVVCLRDPQFEDLFEQLGACLIDAILASETPVEAVRAVVRQIERWRRFLEKRRETLSSEEVRGLIGELAVLERLAARIGPDDALSSWKAPEGSIRDFECPDVAIEVKTFMSSTGASVRISDPLQLEPEPGVPLLLACLELSRTQRQGCTLPDHIARVLRLFSHDITLAEKFENALALVGYLAVHADLYCDGFVIGATYAFPVADDFPRIRAADIPPHVIGVLFSLEVLPLTRSAVDPDIWIGRNIAETANG